MNKLAQYEKLTSQNSIKKLERYEKFISQNSVLLLVSLLIIGVLIRLYGINFGLPYFYDPDERAFLLRGLKILANRDLNPHWFGHPGTTVIYMLSGIYALIFIIGKGLGVFAGPEDFQQLFFQDPTIFILSGRLLSLVFGVATIFLVYIITNRLFNKVTALIATVFITLSPVHIYYSKLIRTDVLMGFLILVAFWYCLNILKENNWSAYLLAGLFTGLAVSTKYPSILFALTIGLTHFLSRGWQIKAQFKLLGSGIACLVGAFLGSPFLFLDFQKALANIRSEARPTHLGATGEGLVQNFVWYLQGPLSEALTLFGLLLVCCGFVLCLTSKQKDKWLLISFPVFFLLFISSLNLRWERWIVPVIPFFCILIAYAIYKAASWIETRFNSRITLGLLLSFSIAVFIPMLHASIRQGYDMSLIDTRTITRQWMINNIPSGSSVLSEANTPQLPKRLFKFFQVKKGDNGALVEVDLMNVNANNYMPGGDLGELKNTYAIQKENINYLVVSDFYDRYLMEAERYPEIVANYEKIMNSNQLIYELKKVPGKTTGPRIRIYNLK